MNSAVVCESGESVDSERYQRLHPHGDSGYNLRPGDLLELQSMSEYTIYHNPRCSKSRATLALLEENGVAPEVVLYLESAPDAAQIRVLIEKLGIEAGALVRRGEEEYKACGLGSDSSEVDLVA